MHRISPTRRRSVCALAGLAALATSPLLAGCRGGQPLALAAHGWPAYQFLFLADGEGWLREDAVRLVNTASAGESLARLESGEIDGAALPLDEVLRARDQGLALSVVLVFDVSAGADRLLVKPGIRQLSELSRKRIGHPATARGTWLLDQVLDRAGLLPGSVIAVPLTADRQLAAWQGGKIDALISVDPLASRLIANSARTLFDSRQTPELLFDVLAIRAAGFHQGDALRAAIAAHFRALRQFHWQRADTAYRLAQRLDLPAPDVLRLVNDLHLPDPADNFRYLSGDRPVLHAAGQRWSQFMRQHELLKQADSLRQLCDPGYLPPIG